MNSLKTTLILGTLLGSFFSAKPSHAVICVPTLYNCNCTYQVPCPITDNSVNSNTSKTMDKTNEGISVIGSKNGLYDTITTPYSEQSISGTNLTQSQQILQNIIRGPNNTPSYAISHPIQNITIPEKVFDQKNLTIPELQAKPNDTTQETYGSARDRIVSKLVTTDPEKRNQKEVEENIDLRRNAYSQISQIGYAKSLYTKEKILQNFNTAKNLEQRLSRPKLLSDDIILNSDMKLAYNALTQDTTEMLSLYVSVKGLSGIAAPNTNFYSALKTREAYQTPQEELDRLQKIRDTYKAHDQTANATEKALREHNALTELNQLMQRRQEIMPYIQAHEDKKVLQYSTEQDMIRSLSGLYENPEQAWALIQQDLRADNSQYTTQQKYSIAENIAAAIDQEITAQRATTRYGTRRKNTCSSSGIGLGNQETEPCLQYSTNSPTSGNAVNYSSIDKINQYYAGYDPYQIRDQMEYVSKTENGNQTNGSSQTKVLMQYYLESQKRNTYYSTIRRGDPAYETQMSPQMYQTLLQNAPSCFTGPLPSTPQNIQSRPDLFDISPNCSYRNWPNGTAIPDSNLGGLNRTVFAINQSVDSYRQNYQGYPAIQNYIQQATNIINASGYTQNASSLGMTSILQNANNIQNTIRQIHQDPKNLQYVLMNFF